jgi:hypothetical protein
MGFFAYYRGAVPRAVQNAIDWAIGQGWILSLLLALGVVICAGAFAGLRAYRGHHTWAQAMSHIGSAVRDFIFAFVGATVIVMVLLTVYFLLADAPNQIDATIKRADFIEKDDEHLNELLDQALHSPLSAKFSDDTSSPLALLNPDYVVIVNIGVAGDLMDNFVSRHSLRFKVINNSLQTFRDIGAVVTGITYGKGAEQKLHISLSAIPVDRSKNVRPKEEIMFGLLEFLDEAPSGLLVQEVDKETSDSLRFFAIRKGLINPPSVAFGIPVLGAFGVQKPVRPDDEISIKVAIYGDNVAPAFATFLVSGPMPPKVRLIPENPSSTAATQP